MDTLPDFNYEDAFKLVERPTFVKVDLDRMLQNVNVVRENISTGTEIIAVVKGNAYGHGLLHVARFLEQYAKVTCFSVATVTEGKELCESGIKSDIIVLGNITGYEISTLIQHRLITCISDIATLEIWNQQRENNVVANGALDSNDVSTRLANLPAPSESLPVIIQVDTGMAVSGCHVDQLAGIMEFCKSHCIRVHSLMTHFVDSRVELDLTNRQLQSFLRVTKPYRDIGIRVHAANSCAVFRGVGTDLDYVRVGVAVYGLPIDSSIVSFNKSEAAGLQPALSVHCRAVRVLQLHKDQAVGYNRGYVCQENDKRVAVLQLGYGDGFSRSMTGGSVFTVDRTECKIVGRVSMDAVLVKVPESADDARLFCVLSDDYDPRTSAAALAALVGTSTSEVCVSLNTRLPRVYISRGKIQAFVK
ncbi:alanine racemase-like [Mya arenaria]|uniref:alanine racemase-like n=1 Tax=Mya arenaria TaxID=6604 RepID=UPI0022E84190|nr:alanine racemase-like [Mya arenaria]